MYFGGSTSPIAKLGGLSAQQIEILPMRTAPAASNLELRDEKPDQTHQRIDLQGSGGGIAHRETNP
jgi:hypothetical protein